MKTEVKTQTIYISDDGKEFTTEKECLAYEKATLSRLKNISYFTVRHGPDLTEGRGLYGLTFIAVETTDHLAYEYATNYCISKYGSCIAYVQGVVPTINWVLATCSEDVWKARKERYAKVGDYSYKSNEVFLSYGEKIDGFPNPQSVDTCPVVIKNVNI